MVYPARWMMAAVLLAVVCAGEARAGSGDAGSAPASALQSPGNSRWAAMTPGELALRPAHSPIVAAGQTRPARADLPEPAALIELEPEPGSEQGGTFGGVSTGGLAIVATGIAAIVLVVLAAGS